MHPRPILYLRLAGLLMLAFLAGCNLPSTTAVPAAVQPPSSAGTASAATPSGGTAIAPGGTDMAATDACSYLTGDEVGKLIGQEILGTKSDQGQDDVTGNPADTCVYRSSDLAVIVSVTYSNGLQGSAQWSQDMQDYLQHNSNDVPTTPVSGVGDQANWYATPDSGGLLVMKYPYLVGIVIGGASLSSPNDYRPALVRIAQLVLERVKGR